MATFNLQIFEDQLLNKDDLLALLESAPSDEIITLDTQGEGPCLTACGIVDLLLESKRDLSKIAIRTPNKTEQLPVRIIPDPHRFSYWFRSMHQAYNKYKFLNLAQDHYRLGCFIGRKNLDRLAILYWLSRRLNVFLSSLHEDRINYEQRPDLEYWVDNVYSFKSWVDNFNIPSIDHYSVDDQYQTLDMFQKDTKFLQVQTNMLNWYNGFDVELVCETFVRGDTYFPTEKTTRPIAGGKPMLVYGPKNFLARLRDQGFKTWADCWDESYDQYEGVERWNRMKEVITQIHAWGGWEWNSLIDNANEIARYNQKYFLEEVALDY